MHACSTSSSHYVCMISAHWLLSASPRLLLLLLLLLPFVNHCHPTPPLPIPLLTALTALSTLHSLLHTAGRQRVCADGGRAAARHR